MLSLFHFKNTARKLFGLLGVTILLSSCMGKCGFGESADEDPLILVDSEDPTPPDEPPAPDDPPAPIPYCDIPEHQGPSFPTSQDGSTTNPFKICTADQLKNIPSYNQVGVIFQLETDITIPPGTTWPSIPLDGTLKGQDFAIDISGISQFSHPSQWGIFTICSSTCSVERLKLRGNLSLLSNLSNGRFGVLASTFAGSGQNLQVDADVLISNQTFSNNLVGLLIGLQQGTLMEIDVEGNLQAASGNLSGSSIGGAFGRMTSGTVSNSRTSVEIQALSGSSATYVGGVVGHLNGAAASLINTRFTGSISTINHAGGIVGYLANGVLSNGSMSGSVTVTAASRYVGGVASRMDQGIIEDFRVNHVSLGFSVVSNHYAGGIVGYLYRNGSIRRSHVRTNVKGLSYVGGIVGYGTTNQSTNQIQLSEVSFEGTAAAQNTMVGGIIGYAYRTAGQFKLTHTYSRGSVSGSGSTALAGGLIGYAYQLGGIQFAYSTASVSGVYRACLVQKGSSDASTTVLDSYFQDTCLASPSGSYREACVSCDRSASKMLESDTFTNWEIPGPIWIMPPLQTPQFTWESVLP